MRLFDIPGQLSLFELFGEDLNEPIVAQPKEKKKKVQKKKKKESTTASSGVDFSLPETPSENSEDDYLARGEKITTLAKERFKSAMNGLELSDYEEKLFGVERSVRLGSMGSWARYIGKKVIRPMLRAETNFGEDSVFMQFLNKMVDPNLSVELRRPTEAEKSGSLPYRFYKSRLNRTDDQLVFTVREDGVPAYSMVGYRCFSREGQYGWRWQEIWPREYSSCPLVNGGDLASQIAYVILHGVCNKALKDPANRPVFENKMMALRGVFAADRLILIKLFADTFGDRTELVDKAVELAGEGANLLSVLRASRSVIMIPRMIYRRPSRVFVKYILEQTGLTEADIVLADNRENREISMVSKNRASLNDGSLHPMAWVLTKSLEARFKGIYPYEAIEHGFGGYSIVESSSYKDEEFVNTGAYPSRFLLGSGNYYYRFAEEAILPAIFDKMASRVEAVKYYKALDAGSRATVYQTKKNIPQKIVTEMSESIFNKSFGYVEFDEDCELEKVRAVAKEFTSFKDRFFANLELKEVSLRFRKLGNHKAAGLYFPSIGCLCVDIGSPGSFIHELGHCIDHIYKKGSILSGESAFDSIWYRYQTLLERYIASGEEKKVALLRGKTKYNKDYYLIRTEVFARCFEMYIADVLGIETSLLNIDREAFDYAYPVDDVLRGLVADYFKPLFEALCGKTEELKAA